MEWSLFQDSEETIHSAEKKLPHMKAFSLCIDNKQQTTMPITKNQRQKLNKMSFSSSNMARFHWWFDTIQRIYCRRGSRYGCETVRHMLKNGLKHKKNAFFACFWAYVRQPHENVWHPWFWHPWWWIKIK